MQIPPSDVHSGASLLCFISHLWSLFLGNRKKCTADEPRLHATWNCSFSVCCLDVHLTIQTDEEQSCILNGQIFLLLHRDQNQEASSSLQSFQTCHWKNSCIQQEKVGEKVRHLPLPLFVISFFFFSVFAKKNKREDTNEWKMNNYGFDGLHPKWKFLRKGSLYK